MNAEMILAADMGGTNLRMAVVDAKGEILYRLKVETPDETSVEPIIGKIIESVEKCQAEVQSIGRIKAFAAAVPATINTNEGIILKAPNVPALDNFPFAEKISDRLSLPVILENDANAAAIGEHTFGAAKGFQNAIMVTLGTGVGGGIIINGQILRGVDSTAGEIGHICVEPFGALCGCGSTGCVEQYSSATGIIRLVNQLKDKFPETVLGNKPDLTALAVYQAAKEGDRLALEVFRQMGFYLGIALADLVNVLNPEVIVIGGGVSKAWDLFINHVREEIKKRAFREPAQRAKILQTALHDDAGILGAARLALDLLSSRNSYGTAHNHSLS